jgi:hypothetical protein
MQKKGKELTAKITFGRRRKGKACKRGGPKNSNSKKYRGQGR